MSTRGVLTLIFLSIVGIASSQTIDVTGKKDSDVAKYRPVLIGKGPTALINQINTQDLVAKGQKEGAVMFICAVEPTGKVRWSATYHVAGDMQILEQELQRKLNPAAEPKLIPAIYDYVPVEALYFGTVTFAVVNGKPRLRIFSNQQIDDVNKESDFVGPQPIFGGMSKFDGLHYPFRGEDMVLVKGYVEVRMKIDENGNLQDFKVVQEDPPFLGFAAAALNDLGGARFIPAFRNGKPVACDVTVPLYYKPPTSKSGF